MQHGQQALLNSGRLSQPQLQPVTGVIRMCSFVRLAAVAALVMALWSFAAQQVVTNTSIRLAQVAALDSDAAALGAAMRRGMMAAFEEANRAGGIHDRQPVPDQRSVGTGGTCRRFQGRVEHQREKG